MEATEEIKSRLDIVDVIQEYLPLKPAGSGSFKGLCPFHHEKSPSFFANRPRQSWHCFGCDQGGDAISFVMQMEGMEFREALELLAQKTGVQLPAFDPAKTSQRKRLYEVNELAAKWFRATLLNDPRAEHARAYAAKREIDELTGDLWKIGYAPNEWDALSNALKKKDVTEEEMIAAGLVGKRESGSGIYDRFRDRLMFTICDIHGNVVGFTGRVLNPDAKEAKYVNTPETPIYKKSLVLYGLDKAKGEIKRSNLAVIVEGNMDVVSSHRAGITNVVASSGTALTGEQLALLKRFTPNLAIAFDQDNAGNAATIRGLDLARALDFNIRIITLPPEAGKDPDDAVRKDPALWREAITRATNIIEWIYRNAFRGRDTSKPEEKKMIARDALTEIRNIKDPVERDAWISRLANDLGVTADALRDAMRMQPTSVVAARPALPKTTQASPPQPIKSRPEQLRERILAILALRPELEPLAQEQLGTYTLAQTKDPDFLNYLTILADREFEDQSLDTLEKELQIAISALRVDDVSHVRQRLEQEMRDAERIGDHAKISELLEQFNRLNTP